MPIGGIGSANYGDMVAAGLALPDTSAIPGDSSSSAWDSSIGLAGTQTPVASVIDPTIIASPGGPTAVPNSTFPTANTASQTGAVNQWLQPGTLAGIAQNVLAFQGKGFVSAGNAIGAGNGFATTPIANLGTVSSPGTLIQGTGSAVGLLPLLLIVGAVVLVLMLMR